MLDFCVPAGALPVDDLGVLVPPVVVLSGFFVAVSVLRVLASVLGGDDFASSLP